MWHLWKSLAFDAGRVVPWSTAVRAHVATGAEPTPAHAARVRTTALVIGVVAAALYALTAHWDAGGRINPGDSAKFQYLPIVNGTPHSTGYPTYLMLSKAFYWALPFLPVSARITLISVLCGACAVAVLFLTAHAYTSSVIASLAAATLFGTSLTFWLVSTDAEVYALHVLFYVSVAWCLVQALLREGGARTRPLYTGLLLYALSFGNHLTSIALAPAVAWTALSVEGKALFRPRRLGLIAGFVLLGVSQYAYIYFLSHRAGGRDLEYIYRDVTLPRLLGYMTGQQFESRFFAFSLREVLSDRIVEFLTTVRRELTLGGALAALGGVVLAALRTSRRGVFVFILLALAGQLFVALNYSIEAGLFFVPVHLLLALLAARGLAIVNHPGLAGATAALVGAVNFYQNMTSSRLVEPSTPVLAQARWQSAQAVGCKQVLAAPSHYFISKIRKYLRYSEEYPLAQPFDQRSEIEVIDSLCVDRSWRKTLLAQGGFYLPLHRDSLSSFLQRNAGEVLLVALWVDGALNPEARGAFEAFGGDPGQLGRDGAYVAVFDRGRLVAESRNVAGAADLMLEDGKKYDGFEPRQRIELVAAGRAFGKRTSIKVGGREQAGRGMSFRIVVLDARQNLLGDAAADPNHLEDFHLFYRAQSLSDTDGMTAVARVVKAEGVAGEVARLVDGVLPPAGSRWDCPECVKLDGPGTAILIELPLDGQQGLTILADNNDSFSVRCASDQRVLGVVDKVKPKGMRRRTLAFAEPCPRVLVELAVSDGRASIGEIEGWRP